MEFFRRLYDLLRHLGDDARWESMIQYIGTPTLYAVLFAIVFAETGLVVTPFLPGDSLLFAIGAIGSRGIGIHLPLITVLLSVVAHGVSAGPLAALYGRAAHRAAERPPSGAGHPVVPQADRP